jgi:Uma2 family endonuclease
MNTLKLNLSSAMHLTDDDFYNLCQANPELMIERAATGELIIMPPTGGERGKEEADLIIDLGLWNRQNNLGIVFSSSTGFKLPNGANRSPDAAWVIRQKWDALTPEQRRKFPPIAPDFVTELRSQTDSVEQLRSKMQEYIENGVRLGWLIDPQTQTVEIYRQNGDREVLQSPTNLQGEDVLPNFVLDLSRIFT